LELYTQLIDLYQRADAYYSRGRIYEDQGMKEEAIADYEIFLKLASQMPNDAIIQMFAYDANSRLEELKK
jgi:tetratricopeptide (TPR) repeat protein